MPLVKYWAPDIHDQLELSLDLSQSSATRAGYKKVRTECYINGPNMPSFAAATGSAREPLSERLKRVKVNPLVRRHHHKKGK